MNTSHSTSHGLEVNERRRFEFGKNWQRFLAVLNPERMTTAENSLAKMLEVSNLSGLTFLDIGSGSGLFSLAARRMNAKVHSFDYDPNSVDCAETLKKKYFENDPNWIIEEGSVLDNAFLARLGSFDVVYSWGVLHHTGQMWKALENAASLVKPNGKLYIAIYNDQGIYSRLWTRLKRRYNTSGRLGRALLVYSVGIFYETKNLLIRLLKGQGFVRSKSETAQRRGMSVWHDVEDWVGGYPFEVAKPEEIFDFFKQKGFTLQKLKTCGGGLSCNEFVFHRVTS